MVVYSSANMQIAIDFNWMFMTTVVFVTQSVRAALAGYARLDRRKTITPA